MGTGSIGAPMRALKRFLFIGRRLAAPAVALGLSGAGAGAGAQALEGAQEPTVLEECAAGARLDWSSVRAGEAAIEDAIRRMQTELRPLRGAANLSVTPDRSVLIVLSLDCGEAEALRDAALERLEAAFDTPPRVIDAPPAAPVRLERIPQPQDQEGDAQ